MIKSDSLWVTFEVSDNQDLPPANSTMSATPNTLASPLGEAIRTEGFDSLGEEQETQGSLEKFPREQVRQEWIDDGHEVWKHEPSKRDLLDDRSDPPHSTHLERQRKRVRIVLDEHSDITRSPERVQMRSGEERFEDPQSRSRYGDMVSFGSYNGMQTIPASLGMGEVQQQLSNSPTVEAWQVLKRWRTGVPIVRGDHLETSNLAEAQETTDVPELAEGTGLIHTPDILTVEQAEIYAHLTSVDPMFGAPPASDSEPVSQRTRSRYADDDGANKAHRFRPFPIQRDTMGGPVMSVDGPVYPLGAELYERRRIAAGFATVSRQIVHRTRGTRGGPMIRGRGGMVRGGASTGGRAVIRGGSEARGGCQTTPLQKVLPSQIQRSSTPQVHPILPRHGPSLTRGKNKHIGQPQMLEMERHPVGRGQKPPGPMDRHVHSQGIPQGQPSGFMPLTMIAPPQSPTPRSLLQRQDNVTISARGPVPGTSYTFPDIERRIARDARIVSRPKHEGQHQQRVSPIRPLQPSSQAVMGISKSRMVPPPSLVTRGRVGRGGGYNIQASMPPLVDGTRGFWRSLPIRPRGPAMLQVVESENGPQQQLPAASQRPAMSPSTERGLQPSFLTTRQRIAMLETPSQVIEGENGSPRPFPDPSNDRRSQADH